MSKWPRASLADVAESVDYGVTASASFEPVGPRFLRITDIQNGSVEWNSVPWCSIDSRSLSEAQLQQGDIVFTRTGATTGKSFLIRDCPSSAVFASYLIRVRLSETADPAFVSHFFQTSDYWSQITRSARGVAQPGVNATTLKALEIPLPPLDEQRRIAAILDKADALRATRRAAIAQLNALTDSVFFDIFGDPTKTQRAWSVHRFAELLSIPLRNGLSPSRSGKVMARVLTLSAITGERFDADAWKTSTFASPPPREQSVEEADFLICRGNGNIRFVGRGFFPTRRMPDVTFPDTMIAARVSSERVEPAFLEHVWNSSAVRRQIESRARTTNGTFKINQSSLAGLTFALPPKVLQTKFATEITSISSLRTRHSTSLAQLNGLFASLQHRAFRGEL